jgi:hypothetical protein
MMPQLRIKPVVRQQQATSPRFEPRFVNGVHTVFNRSTFSHGLPLGTAKEAQRVADELNAGRMQW